METSQALVPHELRCDKWVRKQAAIAGERPAGLYQNRLVRHRENNRGYPRSALILTGRGRLSNAGCEMRDMEYGERDAGCEMRGTFAGAKGDSVFFLVPKLRLGPCLACYQWPTTVGICVPLALPVPPVWCNRRRYGTGGASGTRGISLATTLNTYSAWEPMSPKLCFAA